MENLRVIPYLYQYVKTNYFTGLFLAFVAVFFALRYTRLFTRFQSFVEAKKINRVIVLGSIVVLGLALRLAWIEICPYRPAFSWEASKEDGAILMEYDGINIYANSVLHGVWFSDENGVPQARRPIGYPLFLSLFYKIFGPSYAVMYGVSLALIALTILAVYFLSSRIFGAASGILAAFFFAIYPPSVYSVILPMDELLFMPLWYWGLYLLFKEIEGKGARWPLLWYGLIFGYTTMTRTQTIFMPLVVGLVYFWLKKPLRKVLVAVVVTAAVSVAITIPWIVRNYKHFGTIIPYAAPSVEFYPFNNTSVKHGEISSWPGPGHEDYEISQKLLKAKQTADIKTMQTLSGQEIRRYILHHPWHFFLSGTERVLFLFAADRSRGVWAIDIVQTGAQYKPEKGLTQRVETVAEEFGFASYYFLLYSFLCGAGWMVFSWRRLSDKQKLLFMTLAVCFLLYASEQYIVFPERRYRFPVEPLMMILGSAWLFRMGRRNEQA